MPHYGPFIHQVHIADGFADDCDAVIQQCLKLESLNYNEFCKIWKKMNMGCMYNGRTLGAEIAELSEEVIQVAKHYMIRNTENFEESVAGLFIVYSLLNLQPYPRFAHLRLIGADLPAIHRIQLVARREKRYDVLYILASVLIKGPVHYCATQREYGMDVALRKYLDIGFTSIDKLGLRPKGVYYRQNEELDIIKDLNTITQRYTQAKMDISKTAEFDRNLRYIDNDLPRELEMSLKKLVSGVNEDQYGSPQSTEKEGDHDQILKKRKLIKERAMKGKVQPVMHLTDLNDRNKRTSGTNPEDTAGADKSTEKACTSPQNAPTESPALNTPVIKDKSQVDLNKKRRIPISPRAFKQSRPINDNYCRNSSNIESEGKQNESNSDSVFEITSVQKLDTAGADKSTEKACTSPQKAPTESPALNTPVIKDKSQVDLNKKRRIPISPRAFKQSRPINDNYCRNSSNIESESKQNESNSDSVLEITSVQKLDTAGADKSTEKACTSPQKAPTESPALNTPVIKDKSQVDLNKKRRIPISPRAFKQSRPINDNYCRNSSNIESESKQNESNSDSVFEITSVQKLDKNVKPSYNKVIEKEKESQEEAEEQELDIKIDTLPVMIRSENQGQNYEIEIIPLYNNDVPPRHFVNRTPIVETYQRKKIALNNISEMPRLSIQEIDDSKQTDSQGQSTVGGSTQIIEISTEEQQNSLSNIIEINKASGEGEKSKEKPKEKAPGISEMPRLSIQEIDDSKQTDSQGQSTVGGSTQIIEISTEEQQNSLSNIIEINKASGEGEKSKEKPKEKTPGIPQPNKRDLKRVHIQSKFKRQGMLPVANFKSSEIIESEENMDEESTEPEESEKQ